MGGANWIERYLYFEPLEYSLGWFCSTTATLRKYFLFLSASDHFFLDLFAESSMNLRKLIDLDRELASNFSEFRGWALNDDAFGFDDLG